MSDTLSFMFNGEEHSFDYDSLTVLEGLELKKLAGLTFAPWLQGLEDLDPEAIRFMVWLTLKREGAQPEGRYSDFDFNLLEVVKSMGEMNADDAGTEPDPTEAETTTSA